MTTLHFSVDEHVKNSDWFDDVVYGAISVFTLAGLDLKLGEMETLAPDAVDYSSGDAQTIYDDWKNVSLLRSEVLLTPDTYLVYIPYYKPSTNTAGREYEFGNEYEELFCNAYSAFFRRNATRIDLNNFNPTEKESWILELLLCHEIGHGFGAKHDGWYDPATGAVVGTDEQTIMFGNVFIINSEKDIRFSEKSLREMGVGVVNLDDQEVSNMRPWRLPAVRSILNYYNIGDISDAVFSGSDPYDRENGTVFDGDPAKKTYFREGYAHHAIDVEMEVGTPLYTPFDCKIVGASSNGSRGCHVEMRSLEHERLYCAHNHMELVSVEKDETIPAGYCVGLSGATGACGFVTIDGEKYGHDHFEMGDRGLGDWNIDPIADPRFRHWFDGIPYSQREGTHPDGFAAWYKRVCLKINGGFMYRAERGGAKEYTFICNEPIVHLWHYAKQTQPGVEVTEAVDLLVPQTDKNGGLLWTANIENEGKQVTIAVNRGAIFGTYFYQAETESGNSNPVRIKVVEPTIIL